MTDLSSAIADGAVVFLDTAPVIYFVEKKPPYFSRLDPVFERVDKGDITVVTSAITLAECLYYPYLKEQAELVKTFTRHLVSGVHVRFVPTTAVIASGSAQLRAQYNLGFADAFQIATAIHAGCDLFLTNDKQLSRVTELSVLVLSDLLP